MDNFTKFLLGFAVMMVIVYLLWSTNIFIKNSGSVYPEPPAITPADTPTDASVEPLIGYIRVVRNRPADSKADWNWFINLSEIQIYDKSNNLVPIKCSGTDCGTLARPKMPYSNLYDGNLTNLYHTVTSNDKIEISLKLEVTDIPLEQIKKIVIVNRKEFPARLIKAKVQLLDTNGDLVKEVIVNKAKQVYEYNNKLVLQN